MAKKKSELPPGWSIVERDGTALQKEPAPDNENSPSIVVPPATEREIKALEQIREMLKNIEQKIAEGKIFALGFVYIGPEASSAGYAWTGAADEHPTHFLANIDLMRADYFEHYQDIVFGVDDEDLDD